MSPSELSRIERGLAPRVPVAVIVEIAAVVGLDASLKLYPGTSPLRDVAHVALLDDLRARLSGSLRWAREVPLPVPGDQRAWDAVVGGPSWQIGVEAETSLRDGQALLRRLQLKARDGGVDRVILLLRGTRSTRRGLAESGLPDDPFFAVPGARALELLRAGADPGGNAIIVLAPRPRPGYSSRQPLSRPGNTPDRLPTGGTTRPASANVNERSVAPCHGARGIDPARRGVPPGATT